METGAGRDKVKVHKQIMKFVFKAESKHMSEVARSMSVKGHGQNGNLGSPLPLAIPHSSHSTPEV